MSLTGVPLLILVSLLAVGLPVGAVVLWRYRRLRVLRTAAMVVVGQLMITLALGLVVNRSQQFFTSWSDLFGTNKLPALPTAAPGVGTAKGGTAAPGGTSATHTLHGSVYATRIDGPTTHIDLPADVYLPPQYNDPAYAHHKFPVLELLDGFPGNPARWLGALHLQQVLDTEIAAGRMQPVVAVLPEQTTQTWHDTECVNAVHGPQFGTYLTTDVRTVIGRQLRVQTSRTGWGDIGYSTGGFCANNLAMQAGYPFTAAVSLSGYFKPYRDRSTGNLFHGNALAQHTNDPLYQVTHAKHLPGLSFYAMCASPDPEPCLEGRAFAAAATGGPVQVERVELPTGGHNMTTWRSVEVPAFDWLASHLTAGAGHTVVQARPPTHHAAGGTA
ncbi:alpha/beta hydrolase [Actinocatenispora rupis]|uniref:Esterase n=1 Tax=Actinocatenispora rupis TaxID=519421 RepID=A0A8J3J7K3_9ACTN|nr:alpha/beta hydrolase-fold protein [Actinocatenispora rupis]GID10858.1 esterase [Actinocatenispora rupis]